MDSHQKGPKKPVIFGFEISSIEKLSTKKLKSGLPSVTFFLPWCCHHQRVSESSVSPVDICFDFRYRRLSEFDWGSLQLLLCVIGIVRGADQGGRVKDGGETGRCGGGGCSPERVNLSVSQF